MRAQTALYKTTVLVEEIAWPRVTIFYTAYGDLFARLCALAAVGLLIASTLKRTSRLAVKTDHLPPTYL